jgi:hypothetical protein
LGKRGKKENNLFLVFLGGRKKTEKIGAKIALPNKIAALHYQRGAPSN